MLARQGSGIHKHLICSYDLQCAPKIELFHSTGQLQHRNVVLPRWRKGAQQCHRAETNTMKATQQDCTERTSNAIVPSSQSMWKAQLPPRGCKFQYLHLFSSTSSTRRHTAFPDGERVAKHIRSSSSVTCYRYCLLRHLASRHTRRFNSSPPPTLSRTQCAVQVKYSLFVANFRRSQVNAGHTRAQSSSFFNRSTPELYSRVICTAAPVALATRK